jgi:small-conductance mechanosensitive channel
MFLYVHWIQSWKGQSMTGDLFSCALAGIFLFLAVRSFKGMLRTKLLYHGHQPGVRVFVSELLFFAMLVMFVVSLVGFVNSSPQLVGG